MDNIKRTFRVRGVYGAIPFFFTLILCLSSCAPPIKPLPITSTTHASSPSPGLQNTPIIYLTATVHDSPTPREPVKSPTAVPSRQTPNPVILICWDAGQAALVYQSMQDGSLPHFADLAEHGLRADYAQTVDPPLSAPAQNSLATGSFPASTGIVSNAFHNPNDSFYWYRQGFDEPLDQAEPVWVTASRHGLVTAALFIVGASPALPSQMADYTIDYGIRDAYSRQVTITLQPSTAYQEVYPTFSPVLQGSYFIPQVALIKLFVLDTSDDQTVNYDTVLLQAESGQTAKIETPPHMLLKIGEWGPLLLLPNLTAGADFLIQEISPTQVRLYHTGIYHNIAAPRSLLEALNRKFSFFPSGPDEYALEHNWITHEDNLYLLERASKWMAAVTAWVFDNYQPDLLVSWLDGFDSASHTYLLVDPQQTDYTPELATQYASYFLRAVNLADQALEIILRTVDLDETTILLTADHGFSAAHTTINVNTLLEKAGLLTLDSRDYVVVEKTNALAVASGGAVNIYINLLGREKDGNVLIDDYAELQSQIVDLLRALVDPNNNQPVFQRVLRREELASIHLDHPYSGDVFAQANPGYNLDGWRGKNLVFEPSQMLAQHGYDSTIPGMHAFFIAAGAGVPKDGRVIPPVNIVDLAPTIAFLLGFPPPITFDGSPIPALAEFH